MEVYSFTQTELEDVADVAKLAIFKALVAEGKITQEEADEWCKNHSVIFRKKGIFRTLSNLWKETEEAKGFAVSVVKLV